MQDPELAAAVDLALSRARAAWPSVALDRDAYAAYITARASDAAGVRRLCTDDLYLACACLRGEPGALAALDPVIARAARFAIGRLSAPAALADEIAQDLRAKLLLGDTPRLASYGGLGAIASWLDVAALRAAISALRTMGREVTMDDAQLVAPASASPELAFLARAHGRALREAFSDAFGEIEVDSRNLLRLHYLDGIGLDRLAVIYKVHASTISRRLAAARDQVLETTRSRLRDRTGLPAADVESLVRALRCEVDVSVSALLAATVTMA